MDRVDTLGCAAIAATLVERNIDPAQLSQTPERDARNPLVQGG